MLTTPGVAPDKTRTQLEAWAEYDVWMSGGGCIFLEEPFGIEIEFRSLASRTSPSPKEWADSYLAAFAASASLELITFDKALHSRSQRSVLL